MTGLRFDAGSGGPTRFLHASDECMVRAYRGHSARMRVAASADMVVVEQVMLTVVSNRRGHIQSGA